MKIEESTEEKNKPKPLKLREKVFYSLVVLVSLLSVVFYNPYYVYFSDAHWILFLSLIVIGGFASYLIYYKGLLDIKFNIFYIVNGVIISSMILGNLIDASFKDVKLTNTEHFKTSASSKVSVRGSIKNIGSMAVKKCALSVTVRAGTNPANQRRIDPKQMFTPSTTFNFDFKSSIFEFDRYWSHTEKVEILDKYFPENSISYFYKHVEIGKSVPYPDVRYHLTCQ